MAFCLKVKEYLNNARVSKPDYEKTKNHHIDGISLHIYQDVQKLLHLSQKSFERNENKN
jgi:hypothetical protein